jgi:hypothetical protein
MRILGYTKLEPEFRWYPNQLLSMIQEIDKIIPEEGTPDTQILIPVHADMNGTGIA